MVEKSVSPWRFLLYLVTFSMVLFIFSSVFFLQFGNNFIPSSVFEFVNSSAIYFNPSVRSNSKEDGASVLSSSLSQSGLSTRVGAGNGEQESKESCGSRKGVLRVYMYDLPPEFHFGLLGWNGKGDRTWPDVKDPSQIPQYPGGLNLQHSIEYWLTLDILSSTTANPRRPCGVVRVKSVSRADVVFVPFFASLSYNLYSKLRGDEKVSVDKKLQDKLVKYLMGRKEWKRSGGKDHLIVAHHPNSLVDARYKLSSAIFVLADFGRYPPEIANLKKDVIAPYKHLVRTIGINESASYDKRPILAYFQGAIYRKDGGAIRQELYYLLKDVKDIHFEFGSIQGNGIRNAGQGMALSKFCLNIAGDTPSSNRLFDAIASHCVPVIISDEIELPYEDVLDYSAFSLFVRSSEAVKEGFLLGLLRGVSKERWTEMWKKLKDIVRHFEYQYPSQPDDAVDMIWKAVSGKISSVQLNQHRSNRYKRSPLQQRKQLS